MNHDLEVAKLDEIIKSLGECIQVDEALLGRLKTFRDEAETLASASRYDRLTCLNVENFLGHIRVSLDHSGNSDMEDHRFQQITIQFVKKRFGGDF